MIITLKGLKTMSSLSEETHCYTATVCIDGKPAFHASNHGHGGCDLYHPVKGYTGPSEREVNEWCAKNLPPYVSPYFEGKPLEQSLEMVVGDLINEALKAKALKRMLGRIVIIGESNGQPALFTYPAKFKPTPENLAKVAAQLKDGRQVVNGNAALEARAAELV